MQILCPRCNAAIPGVDIDLAHDRALCRPCGEVLSLSAELVPVSPPAEMSLARPADLRVVERRERDALALAMSPSRWRAVPTLGVAAIWDAVLVFWYWSTKDSLASPVGFLLLLCPLLHVGLGVLITWSGLCTLFNTTRLDLTREVLTVEEGPIPTLRRLRMATAQIDRFEAGHCNVKSRGCTREVPVLKAITRDGIAVELKLELEQDDHAAWLAEQLNRALVALQGPPEPLTYRG